MANQARISHLDYVLHTMRLKLAVHVQVILHLLDVTGLLLLVVNSRIGKVSLYLCQETASVISTKQFSARNSLPDMGYFTFAHMNVCAKGCPRRFSSLVVEAKKVGIELLLALVRATLTGRASRDRRACGQKVTAELPSNKNWQLLSQQ